jgi:hypothetical protein
MLVLRFATVLAIAVWIGGLLVLGAIAAPAIFDVVALRQVPDARLLSGAIFGEVLRRFHLVSYGCAAVILIALSIRAVLGPRPRRFSTRLALTLLMLAGALYSGMVLSSRIAQVQQEIGVGIAPSSLPAGDPRRVEFGRLHGQSTLVQLAPLVGGLVLMLFELRDSVHPHVSRRGHAGFNRRPGDQEIILKTNKTPDLLISCSSFNSWKTS